MDLKAIQAQISRITDLRRNLMNLTDAFESCSAITKPAVAHAIALNLIELQSEIDDYLALIPGPGSADLLTHIAPAVQQ
jgi:hypothetical protein